MTQKTRHIPQHMLFYNGAQDFARRVEQSVLADLEAMRQYPAEATPAQRDSERRARNRALLHAFGFSWQHHHQHHDAKGGEVNVMLLRVWRESAGTGFRDIADVAESTRHVPLRPADPALN